MLDYEKLGSFYLGRAYDIEQRQRRPDLVLYDSKDLLTHAVCVGMTGSGKTGLCIDLIEEAAIDGVPALVIDPKGDLSNLLLTFPQLRPDDFAPWVDADEARRKGITPDQMAAQQAALWTKGLADWSQDGARIERLRQAADFAIYTPGSSAGLPLSILRSFDAPPPALRGEADLYRERVAATATSLLALAGIEADPVRSREHILISTILDAAWQAGRSLDLPALVQQVQSPPLQRIGVMEIETFYPAGERFGLAMQLNNLIAAPGFAAWTAGEPLDVQALLYTPSGKPRVSILSIAHLNDSERMFFVSLLLSQVLGWTRTQAGTSSLRALLYMDEIAGYCPPVANPPSKAPLLTLMKQARAFGVGLVLATQNPVDLDYKGLANAGTWLIGRLQTQRDKERVLDGLEGAAATASSRFDRAEADRLMSALSSRVFLMNNVHDDGPTVFESRWALSYLRGPLTREQIRTLMAGRRGGPTDDTDSTDRPDGAAAPVERASADYADYADEQTVQSAGGAPSAARQTVPPPLPTAASAAAAAAAAQANAAVARAPRPSHASFTSASSASSADTPAAVGGVRPVLPPDVPQYFAPPRAAPPDAPHYHPKLLGLATVYYADAKLGVDQEQPAAYLAEFGDGLVKVDWHAADETDLREDELSPEPLGGARFESVPAEATRARSYASWKKDLADMIFRTARLELLACEALEAVSRAGESERDFRARLVQAAREQRDAQVEKLRARFAPKLATLNERLRRAQQALEAQQAQASEAKLSTAVSFGSALLSAFLGKKSVSAGSVGKAGTAIRGAGRAMRESGDVGRAAETVEAVQQQIAALEQEFQSEVDALAGAAGAAALDLSAVSVRPKKTNIKVRALALVWVAQE